MANSPRSDEGRTAGMWAIDQLHSALGDQWLIKQAPEDLLWSPYHAGGFSELLDLGLKLHFLRDASGMTSLLKDLGKDVKQGRRVHSRLMLEVAGLASQHGYEVALEKRYAPGLAPTDVVLTTPTGRFGVEVFALLKDRNLQDGEAYADQIFSALGDIESKYGVAVRGKWEGILDAKETSNLLAEIEKAASLVAGDSRSRVVEHFAGTLTVSSRDEASLNQSILTGPLIGGMNNDRFLSRLVQKSSRAIKAGSTWIRVDVLDGLWQLTQWSTWPLKEKGEAIANEVRRAVGSLAELHGVILSSGPATAQGVLANENVDLDGGSFALRRLLPPVRVRETIILLMHNAHESEAAEWLAMYHKEPDWLNWALESVGLSPSAAVFDFRI
jgi:hypothetical protein